MGEVVVVSGTGTDVGKTVVTAAAAANACAAGRTVAVVKAAQTGVTSDMAGDVETIGRLVGAGTSYAPVLTLRELIRYEPPLAPATAARLTAREALTLPEVVSTIERLASDHDLVLVEGAGGLNVRFADDPEWTIADLAGALSAPVLVVVAAGLGTLNTTSLTLEAMALRGLRCHGLVIGRWPDHPDLAASANIIDLERLVGRSLSGAVPDGVGAPAPERFREIAAGALSPELGGRFDAADFRRRFHPKDLV